MHLQDGRRLVSLPNRAARDRAPPSQGLDHQPSCVDFDLERLPAIEAGGAEPVAGEAEVGDGLGAVPAGGDGAGAAAGGAGLAAAGLQELAAGGVFQGGGDGGGAEGLGVEADAGGLLVEVEDLLERAGAVSDGIEGGAGGDSARRARASRGPASRGVRSGLERSAFSC